MHCNSYFLITWVYFISLLPSTLTLTFTSQIHDSIVVNLSILSLSITNLFFLFIDQKLEFISFDRVKYFIFFLNFILLLFCFWFDYNFKLGGGYFIKLSAILFDNLYFLFNIVYGIIVLFHIVLKIKKIL